MVFPYFLHVEACNSATESVYERTVYNINRNFLAAYKGRLKLDSSSSRSARGKSSKKNVNISDMKAPCMEVG